MMNNLLLKRIYYKKLMLLIAMVHYAAYSREFCMALGKLVVVLSFSSELI